MQYISDVSDLQLHNTAIAFGKFDGFHRGHQLLLQQVRNWQEQGLRGVIFTFGQPKQNAEENFIYNTLGTEAATTFQSRHIDSHEEKLYKAEKTGIDIFLEYPFTKEFSSQTPEEFVQKILVEQLDVKAVAVGQDFRFGRNRTGDADLLQNIGKQYGFQVVIFEKLKLKRQEISSSLIREAVQQGDMEFITEAMGQGYSIYGEVIHGAGLGHTIGIPTINQIVSGEKILPPFGVYAAKCHIGEQVVYGVANLGCKPTVSHQHQIGLETNLFDFHQDIYGEMAEVELLHFIRPEQKFETVDALVEQMKCDIEYAKKLLCKK